MLVLAGAGLHPGSVGREVEDLATRADVVYVDTYTMPGAGWLLEWARRRGRRVVEASRSILEAGSTRLVEEASRSLVLVLVPGDPLIATTHIALIAEAARRGVPWRVVPGVSGVVAAKTLSGLQYYRFGRTVTVPGPWRGVKAFSVVLGVYGNICVGLHTLLLLDISESGRQLDPGEAARILLNLEAELAGEHELPTTILGGLLAALVVRAGMPGASVEWTSLAGLASEGLSTSGEPASLVVPGIIHPTEADVIRDLYGVEDPAVEAHNGAVRRLRGDACRIYAAEVTG